MLNKAVWFVMIVSLSSYCLAEDPNDSSSFWSQFSKPEIHGFIEGRSGYRLQNDPYEKDMSIMEGRLQLDLSTYNDWADFKFKGDLWGDGVLEKEKSQTRELWMFTRPTDFMDVKVGRQVLTWGTGDLLFLNDLFPKDWQSFFIGRDVEYLKAPSDAVKFSFFNDIANIDLVYTPKFDSDDFITGEYNSYWNGNLGRLAGRDAKVSADKPNSWFRDDEIAFRIYKNVDDYEYALYGYRGFWKSPGGQTPAGIATFPDLNTYGASVRGQLGKGIANAEIAYYQSLDDEGGENPLVNNSEVRYLLGYNQEAAKDFNVGVQYYVEQMLNYGNYRKTVSATALDRDEFRHVVTLRLTKLLMNQNLRLSLFTFYSPNDRDAYLRPNIHYKLTDNIAVEAGANVFLGASEDTFFGQFEKDTNIYTAVRYSF